MRWSCSFLNAWREFTTLCTVCIVQSISLLYDVGLQSRVFVSIGEMLQLGYQYLQRVRCSRGRRDDWHILLEKCLVYQCNDSLWGVGCYLSNIWCFLVALLDLMVKMRHQGASETGKQVDIIAFWKVAGSPSYPIDGGVSVFPQFLVATAVVTKLKLKCGCVHAHTSTWSLPGQVARPSWSVDESTHR